MSLLSYGLPVPAICVLSHRQSPSLGPLVICIWGEELVS